MPRRVRQIEIYLPLSFNDGAPIATEVFRAFEIQLLTRFGGVTSTHREFPLQGLWQSEGTVFQDKVLIFSVMDFSKRGDWETLRYLLKLKTRFKKKFDQLDILITLQELTAI